MIHFFLHNKAGFLLVEIAIASCMMSSIVLSSFYYHWQLHAYHLHAKKCIEIVYDMYDFYAESAVCSSRLKKSTQEAVPVTTQECTPLYIEDIRYIPLKRIYRYMVGNKEYTVSFIVVGSS